MLLFGQILIFRNSIQLPGGTTLSLRVFGLRIPAVPIFFAARPNRQAW